MTFDLLLAFVLPFLGVIQAASLIHDYRKGQSRISPMHYFEKDKTPKAFAAVLIFNIVLVALLFLMGIYFASKAF